MNLGALHLFLELFTLASFLATGAWARRRFGGDGVWLCGFLFVLGALRENFVTLVRLLYGYADLHLKLGRAPLLGAIIWPFSILAAVAAADALGRRGSRFELDRLPTPRELGWVALFLASLAGFFEPFLKEAEMARWQEGTATWLGVPKIALIGYPTLAVASLVASGWILGRTRERGRRLALFAAAAPLLALVHALGLQGLKDALGW